MLYQVAPPDADPQESARWESTYHQDWQAVVTEHQPMVYATALEMMRNGRAAEEVAHETFVRAFQKIDQLREPKAIGAWLRTIAKRLCLNRITRKGPSQFADGFEDNLIDGAELPMNIIILEQQIAKVRKAIRRLPGLDREAINLFYIQGESIRAISERLDAPEGTIKRRLHVARNRLRELIDDKEEFADLRPESVPVYS